MSWIRRLFFENYCQLWNPLMHRLLLNWWVSTLSAASDALVVQLHLFKCCRCPMLRTVEAIGRLMRRLLLKPFCPLMRRILLQWCLGSCSTALKALCQLSWRLSVNFCKGFASTWLSMRSVELQASYFFTWLRPIYWPATLKAMSFPLPWGDFAIILSSKFTLVSMINKWLFST